MSWLSVARNRYRASSDPLRTERRIELAVVLLALLLVAQLIYGAVRLAFIAPPKSVEPTADSLLVMNSTGHEKITQEQSSEIRSRPLFWPGRRPLEAVVSEATAQKAKRQDVEGITLLGIFGAGKSAGVIVRIKDQNQRFHLGEQMHGWKLASVGTNEAVITAGKRRETLVLQQQEVMGSNGKVGKRSERKK